MLSSTHLSHHTFDHTFSHTDQASKGFTQLTAGKGEMANITPPTQTSALLGLPTEILVYLLQYLQDTTTPLLLSSTCHQLRSIYQDERLYIAQERERHRFIYMLNTPALYDALNAKLPNKKLRGIRIPYPHTPEWIQLRNHPLPMNLTQEAWQIAFIQKTYLTAWELLQTAECKDKSDVLKLMQIIGKLSAYIDNTETYAKKLFDSTFPKVWLSALVTINLDWGLQLICGHFAWCDVEPFVKELDPALTTLLSEARDKTHQWQFSSSMLKHKPYASFLSYVLERFYLFGSQANVELIHPAIQALLESMLADPKINYNAEDEKGRTLLLAACQNNREALVTRYLQHPDLDINKKSLGQTALDWAVKNEALTIIQALLAYGVAESTHIGAFNYAIWLQKAKIAHTLWQHAKDRHTFVEQASIQAINNYGAEVIYSLIKEYQANPHTLPPDYYILGVALEDNHLLLLDLLLLDSDLKLNVQGEEGKTLLHEVINLKKYPQKQLTQLVTRLLAEGADCNAVNDKGKTPLILACSINQPELTKLLLPYAPDMNARDNEGNSALDYAVLYGTVDLVQALLAYEVASDTLLSAFNQGVYFKKDSMAEILLHHAKRQGNELFVNQALARAKDKGQQGIIDKLQKEYGAF
jgi:ankyrin repeat protein